MQIRMLDTWAYDVVPGQIRRTLPAGQTFDEPVEIAQAAIDAGAAERIVAIAAIVDQVDPAEVDPDLDAGDADGDDGADAGDGETGSEGGAGESEPAPVPAAPEPVAAKPGRGRAPVTAIPAPAEPVEPV